MSEVAERIAEGRTDETEAQSSRSISQIVRANVVTPFNGLLVTLFVVILAAGRWQNGLFGFVIVANSAIGVLQEVRAKRTLDRLAVLNAPQATVVRDAIAAQVTVGEIVADDLLELRAGDQVPADGVLQQSAGLELDESLLTGESDPIAKLVGDEAYATKLAQEAKKFTLIHSELAGATNRLLRGISLMLLVVGPLLLWSQFRSNDNKNWQDAVTGAVAALVGMVSEVLVLLTSLAFFVVAVSLSRRKTLVQELPAVEVLAHVDVVCLDKTGTLTDGDIEFDELIMLPGGAEEDVRQALALSAGSDDANSTAATLSVRFTDCSWDRTGGIPFSSGRKWTAVSAADKGTWVLGAPEMVMPRPPTNRRVTPPGRADEIAATGRRVSCSPRTRMSWTPRTLRCHRGCRRGRSSCCPNGSARTRQRRCATSPNRRRGG